MELQSIKIKEAFIQSIIGRTVAANDQKGFFKIVSEEINVPNRSMMGKINRIFIRSMLDKYNFPREHYDDVFEMVLSELAQHLELGVNESSEQFVMNVIEKAIQYVRLSKPEIQKNVNPEEKLMNQIFKDW